MASLLSKAKSLAKRVVGQPEDGVPVQTVQGWVKDLGVSPKRDVCIPLLCFARGPWPLLTRPPKVVRYAESLFPIFGWITRYSEPSSVPSMHIRL